jgi:hypothetical protein
MPDVQILGETPRQDVKQDLTKRPGYDPGTDIYTRPPAPQIEILGTSPREAPPVPAIETLRNKGLQIQRQEESDIDYYTGAPAIVRAQVQGAANPTEVWKILERDYGRGNFGQDRNGNWWVKQRVEPADPRGAPPQQHAGVTPTDIFGLRGGRAPQGPPERRRVAVLPQGVVGEFKKIVSGAVASPWTTGGGMLGAAYGAGIGAPFGGPVGAIGGAMVGAALGRGMDDFTHWVRGIFHKTPGEVVSSMALEAAIAGGFQAAGPALGAAYRGTKRAVQSWVGTRGPAASPFTRGTGGALVKRPSEITEGARFGRELGLGSGSGRFPRATPPITSYAPGATGMEAKQHLRDLLGGPGGSGKEQRNIVYLNARMRGVLQEQGFSDSEINQMMDEVRDTSYQLSRRAAGEAVVRRAQDYHGMLQDDMHTSRMLAQRQLDGELRALGNLMRAPDATSENVADAIVSARRRFSVAASQAYEDVDKLAGDTPRVPTAVISTLAKEIVASTPPQAVPDIIKMMATGKFVIDPGGAPGGATRPAIAAAKSAGAPAARPPGAGDQLSDIRKLMEGMGAFEENKAGPAILPKDVEDEVQHFITFGQAHRLRTWLREKGDIPDIAAQGITGRDYRRMAKAVEEAINSMQGDVGRTASTALQNADTFYREGIRKFNDRKINQLVKDINSGMPPEPEHTAALIMDPNYINVAREIFRMVPSSTRYSILQADLNNMITSASHIDKERGRVLDGKSLLNIMDQRDRLLQAIYGDSGGRGFLNRLRQLAAHLAAYDGQIDINSLSRQMASPTQVIQLLEQAEGSKRAADEYVRRSVLGAFVNGTPVQVDRALYRIISPGQEAVTESVARELGVDSPQWQLVQRYALQRLLSGATQDIRGLQKTIAGDAINKVLSRYTPRQQELLFPGGLADDLRTLAREAKYLFPNDQRDMASSFAARNIQLHLPGPISVIKYIHAMAAGWIADHPRLLRWLTDEVKADPERARAIGRVLWQWAIQRSLSPGPGRGKPEPQATSPTELGRKPKQEDRAPGYGGTE